ncbi:lipopolysaccharide heptosyltransferase RfaC [Glaesserella sp.]|uniref:lipopolysaccharide heptosyltransferase RfaC n=1 Tax=Glaesserella sp. TaxID=2094731 RepID=UPI00359F42C4
MNICLVKTSSMGDVIHTLPALTDAQRIIPNLQVDWVVEQSFAEIPRWHGAVNQVIPVAIRRWRKNLLSAQTWQEWQTYKTQLQTTQYDAVIDAQGLLKSALLATRLAKGTKYGYDKHSAREGLSACFYDNTFSIPYHQHAVERIRQLFARSLGYTVPESIGDYGLRAQFANYLPDPTACSPYLIAVHATTREDKHWQEAYWATLFKSLTTQGFDVRLPWGNERERERAERLAKISERITVLPKLTLTELAQQIAGARAVISVDTGLSHLTAALDRPNIILYGATDPQLIGAYGKHQIYLSGNGMETILPQQVEEALSGLFSANGAKTSDLKSPIT